MRRRLRNRRTCMRTHPGRLLRPSGKGKPERRSGTKSFLRNPVRQTLPPSDDDVAVDGRAGHHSRRNCSHHLSTPCPPFALTSFRRSSSQLPLWDRSPRGGWGGRRRWNLGCGIIVIVIVIVIIVIIATMEGRGDAESGGKNEHKLGHLLQRHHGRELGCDLGPA